MFDISNIKDKRMFHDYYLKHGCKIIKDRVLIPCICPHLTKNNICDIHESKPLLCKLFKGQKSDRFYIPDGCGFK